MTNAIAKSGRPAPMLPDVEHASDGTIVRHPAFAHISASRCSSSPPGVALFGSDFRHQHFMTVRISRAEQHRTLSSDWSHDREEVVEVWMSEAQWATFISTPNQHPGAQCSLRFIKGEPDIPQIAAMVDRREQLRKEVQETLGDATKAIDDAQTLLDEAQISAKAKKIVGDAIRKARQELSSNLGFVADQFDEHAEKTVARAKTEVAAYVAGAVRSAGLAASANAEAPLLLDEAASAEIEEVPKP